MCQFVPLSGGADDGSVDKECRSSLNIVGAIFQMRNIFAAAILLIGIAVVAYAGFTKFEEHRRTSAQDTQTKEDTLVAAASSLNDQWKSTFDKTGHYPERQNPVWHQHMLTQLLQIASNSPNYATARNLIEDFAPRQRKIIKSEEDKRRLRLANDSDGRTQFASRLEVNFLKDGREMRVKAYGSRNTILEFDNILINRPFVYKATNETNLLGDAWNAGFKKVIFRGHLRGAPWVYEAPKNGNVDPRQ